MFTINNNRFFILTLILISCLVLMQCQPSASSSAAKLHKVQGETMGTYYKVSYMSNAPISELQQQCDSLLQAFNNSVSTYIPNSIISGVNQANTGDTTAIDAYFTYVFKQSKQLYLATNGNFDPSVMPLVNFWGFGYEKNRNIDTTKVDSLLQLIDFDSFTLLNNNTPSIVKNKSNTQLDFSALAKGYGVDLLAQLLEKNGCQRYLVDIGGELVAKGTNASEKIWTIGIDKPIDSLKTRSIQNLVQLNNQAIATSGNYRNFYVENGVKYAHTINPKTGYPELSNLLSTSIVAKNCLTADALATACMVMGYPAAKTWIASYNANTTNDKVSALFIFSNNKGELVSDTIGNISIIEQ